MKLYRLIAAVMFVTLPALGCSDSDVKPTKVTPDLEAGQKAAEQQANDEEREMQKSLKK